MNTDHTFNLSGHVRHQGLSLAGVRVLLFDQFAHEGDSLVGSEPLRELKTGSKGDFSFSVKTGVYRIEVIPASATRILGHSLSEIKVTTNTNLNISLATGSIVSGHINSSTQSQLSAEMLTATEVIVLGIEPSSYKAVSPVSADGSFSLVVPRGKYHIALRCAHVVDAEEPKFKLVATHSDVVTITNDVDLSLEWPDLLQFRGEIVDHAGQAVPFATITVEPAASRRSLLLNELDFAAKTESDADGRFQLALEAGSYDIAIEAPNSSLFGCRERDFTVTAGCEKRYVLAQGHRLKGQVIFDEHLLSQSLVRLQGLDGDKQEYITRTDIDGQFAITIPDGNYKLIVQAHPKDTPPVTIDGIEYSAIAPWTRNIVVGGDTHVAVRLVGGTALRGRISDDSGQARAGIKVSVFAAQNQNQFIAEGRSPLAYGITDGEGAYCLFLEPGQYWLVVHNDFDNAKLVEIGSEPITEDIVWHGWSQIKFEVFGADNQLIPRCQVFYQPYGSDSDFSFDESQARKGALPLPHGFVLTGEQGGCLLILPSGVYTFRFVPPEAGSYTEKTIRQLSISADISRKVSLELKPARN